MHKVGIAVVYLACTVLAIFNKSDVRQCLNDSEPWDTHWQIARLWLVAGLPAVALVIELGTACNTKSKSESKCIDGFFLLSAALFVSLAVVTAIYTTEYCKKDEHTFDNTMTGAELSDCFTAIAAVAAILCVGRFFFACRQSKFLMRATSNDFASRT